MNSWCVFFLNLALCDIMAATQPIFRLLALIERNAMVRIVFIVLSVLCCLCYGSNQQGQCPADRQTRIKLYVNSYRNQTGHWVSHVQVQNDPNNKLNTARWNVEVEQRTQDCDQGNSIIIDAIITSPPPRAGPGYELFPGIGYYKFHTSPVTWDEAKETCEKEGAHLAVINSEEESGVLASLFTRYPQIDGIASVGFHDKYIEGEYVTIFGEPLSSTGFTKWSTFGAIQPDNAGGNPGEDCGSIHTNGLLNDIGCTTEMAFFCEQEL